MTPGCEGVTEALKRAGAPPKIVEAGECIDEALAARIRPSGELVSFVQQWWHGQTVQNRYGL